MADSDKEKWDSRYLQDIGILTPSTLLENHVNHANVGRALDIACGNGRNSIFLADKGFTVDAVDISSVALESLSLKATAINTICKDLDLFSIQENSYDLIINANFLDRRLFPMVEAGLKAGGLLIFESFAGNKTSKYCLGPNELLQAFSSLHVIYYEEKETNHSEKFEKSVSLVAIKTALCM